jgi:tetratricopeptide (TPR) repeat protein
VEFARELHDDRVLIQSLATLCDVCYFAGEPDRGLPLGQEAVERARQLGNDVLLAASLTSYLLAGDLIDPARSELLYAEAIACTERSGHQLINSFLHNNAGVHALRVGDVPAARAHLEQAGKAMEAIGATSHHVLVNLGWVLREEGDPDGARARFAAGLRLSRRNGERSGLAYSTVGLACVAADLGDPRQAAELHGVAQAFLDGTGEPWQDPEAGYRLDSVRQVRTCLGEEEFERAYAHGMTLSLDQALDLALGRIRSA